MPLMTGVAIAAFLFAIGFVSMQMFEPEGSPLKEIGTYTWWFAVTVTTVGYGDYAPITLGGRVAAVIVFIGGIGTIGLALGEMFLLFEKVTRRRMSGLKHTYEGTDQIVILGYHPGRTELLVEEILADVNRENRDIVLCFAPEQASQNPFPDNAFPVQGKLTSDDVMTRSGIAQAGRIIIDGQDDNETMAIAITVESVVNQACHIVVALNDPESNAELIHRLDPCIECVTSSVLTMMIQAMQDPGITRLYTRLLSNREGSEGYRIVVPDEAPPKDLMSYLTSFKQNYNATILAVAESESPGATLYDNPSWDFEIRPGMVIYYVAEDRLANISWT